MKHKLILFAMLLMATGLRAQTLVVHLKNGTTTNVELSKKFRMAENGDNLAITTSGGQLTISRADIDGITFQQAKGDVNRDGDVGIGDIVTITNIMAGIGDDDEEPAN